MDKIIGYRKKLTICIAVTKTNKIPGNGKTSCPKAAF